MNKIELVKKLQEIRKMGFVESTRSGTTGIGHTLEFLLGINESNIAVPDIGARIEVKATRRNRENWITLFTFNKGVWKISQRELIEKYGYKDRQGRQALKNTLVYEKKATVNLFLRLKESENIIDIVDDQERIVGSYDLYEVVGKYMVKLGRVLFCIADTKVENKKEYFHFNEFYLLSDTSSRRFIAAFKNGYIGIDLRMHLTPSGVRNRGTAFRIKGIHLKELYERIEKLV